MAESAERQPYKHALVIGKFYPPHNGHMYLIEEAARVARYVTVLVYANQYQHIPADDRVAWIREHFKGSPRVRIEPLINEMYDDYVDENVWESHDHALQAKLRVLNIPASGIDVIVSSEDYGDTMTRYFPNAKSHVVDKERKTFPISGTKSRGDLFGNWEFLPVSTRKGLIPRVIVLGAESTGTTTLALALTEHYKARYVPEYGREYTIDWLEAMREATPDATMDDLVWREPDFERIGKKQTMLENRAAAKIDGFPLVIGDTDAFATAIWQERYLGGRWQEIIESEYAQVPRRDLYLITDWVGVPLEDDGYRDGDDDVRARMTRDFEDALTKQGAPWVLLRGTHEERMKIAVKLIDRVLEKRLKFD